MSSLMVAAAGLAYMVFIWKRPRASPDDDDQPVDLLSVPTTEYMNQVLDLDKNRQRRFVHKYDPITGTWTKKEYRASSMGKTQGREYTERRGLGTTA